jgi:acetylornithine deacetylase
MTAAEILRELVAVPTPSAVSNLPLLAWVSEFLGARGWTVELLSYEDEAGVAKGNLIAWPGHGERLKHVDLVFVCHTDTVPFAEEWVGALVLEERGDNLHGCGSCDVKGALACFLAAVGLDSFGSVALILTGDEEIGCKGMERLLRVVDLRIVSAIVSEPTSLRAGIAGKGYGLARVTVTGREAHSAFPQQGVSAISVAARLILRIEEAFVGSASSRLGDSSPDLLFDPPRTTLNIGVIEGGTAKNIVPGRCSFLVEWRAVPGEAPGAVVGRLQGLVEESRAASSGVAVELEELRDEPGFSPVASGPLRVRLEAALGGSPMGISFGSEASRLARIADEVIVIGPGDMRTAHSDRECVPIAELERWTCVLRGLIAG